MIFNDPTHEWCKWDFLLIKAYYFLENMMQGDYPIWIADSDRVRWEVEKKTSRPQAALDKAKHDEQRRMDKKGASPKYGLQFVLKPKVSDGGAMPTLREWLEERADKDAKKQQ